MEEVVEIQQNNIAKPKKICCGLDLFSFACMYYYIYGYKSNNKCFHILGRCAKS